MSTPETNLPSPSAAPERPASKILRDIAWGVLLLLGLTTALFVSFAKAILAYGGRPDDSHGWGYVMGATLAPLILASLAVGVYYIVRKAARTRRKVVSYIVLWTLVFAFVSRSTSTAPQWPKDKAEAGQLLVRASQEASGVIPPEQHSKDEVVAVMRDMFRDMYQFNQEYMEEAAGYQSGEIQNLYQPSSFRNRETVEETIRQLKNMAAVEKKYASLEPVFTRARERIAQKDWPEGTKRGFLKGMEEPFRQGNEERLALHAQELKWIDATVDLYMYALDHFAAFSVRGNRIEIADEEARNTFNQKMETATRLHTEVLQALSEHELRQKGKLAPYGVDPSELRPSED